MTEYVSFILFTTNVLQILRIQLYCPMANNIFKFTVDKENDFFIFKSIDVIKYILYFFCNITAEISFSRLKHIKTYPHFMIADKLDSTKHRIKYCGRHGLYKCY